MDELLGPISSDIVSLGGGGRIVQIQSLIDLWAVIEYLSSFV